MLELPYLCTMISPLTRLLTFLLVSYTLSLTAQHIVFLDYPNSDKIYQEPETETIAEVQRLLRENMPDRAQEIVIKPATAAASEITTPNARYYYLAYNVTRGPGVRKIERSYTIVPAPSIIHITLREIVHATFATTLRYEKLRQIYTVSKGKEVGLSPAYVTTARGDVIEVYGSIVPSPASLQSAQPGSPTEDKYVWEATRVFDANKSKHLGFVHAAMQEAIAEAVAYGTADTELNTNSTYSGGPPKEITTSSTLPPTEHLFGYVYDEANGHRFPVLVGYYSSREQSVEGSTRFKKKISMASNYSKFYSKNELNGRDFFLSSTMLDKISIKDKPSYVAKCKYSEVSDFSLTVIDNLPGISISALELRPEDYSLRTPASITEPNIVFAGKNHSALTFNLKPTDNTSKALVASAYNICEQLGICDIFLRPLGGKPNKPKSFWYYRPIGEYAELGDNPYIVGDADCTVGKMPSNRYTYFKGLQDNSGLALYNFEFTAKFAAEMLAEDCKLHLIARQ